MPRKKNWRRSAAQKKTRTEEPVLIKNRSTNNTDPHEPGAADGFIAKTGSVNTDPHEPGAPDGFIAKTRSLSTDSGQPITARRLLSNDMSKIPEVAALKLKKNSPDLRDQLQHMHPRLDFTIEPEVAALNLKKNSPDLRDQLQHMHPRLDFTIEPEVAALNLKKNSPDLHDQLQHMHPRLDFTIEPEVAALNLKKNSPDLRDQLQHMHPRVGFTIEPEVAALNLKKNSPDLSDQLQHMHPRLDFTIEPEVAALNLKKNSPDIRDQLQHMHPRVGFTIEPEVADLDLSKNSPDLHDQLPQMQSQPMNSNEIEQTFSNEIEETRAKEVEHTFANQFDQTLANEIEQTFANQFEQTLANEIDQTFANQFEQTHAHEFEQSFANEIELDITLQLPEVNALNQYKNSLDLNQMQNDMVDLNIINESELFALGNYEERLEHNHPLQQIEANSDDQWQPSTSRSITDSIPSSESNCFVINASYHQGHQIFGESSGRQCLAMSLSSMIHSHMTNAINWTTNDLNTIMFHGNELYASLQQFSTINDAYLNVEELPENVEINGTIFHLRLSPTLYGLLSTQNDDDVNASMSLKAALRRSFDSHSNVFVTFCEATFAILSINGTFHVFDSHSRSQTGELSINGTCIVAQYNTLEQVHCHCMRLAKSMNSSVNSQFEVTPVTVTAVPSLERIVTPNEPSPDTSTDTSFPLNTLENEDEDLNRDEIEHDKLPPQSFVRKRKRNISMRNQQKKKSMRKSRADKRPLDTMETDRTKSGTKLSRYSLDAEYREQLKQASRLKYAKDVSHRESVKSVSINKYSTNKSHCESVKSASISKYATNKSHCESVKSASINKYATNSEHHDAVIAAGIDKYAHNTQYRNALKSASIDKYASDEIHHENVKSASIDKYASDEIHRGNVKSASIDKYAADEIHRENVKSASIDKYASDEIHRENVKSASIDKYASDELHRENVKSASIDKYAMNPEHRAKVKTSVKNQRLSKKQQQHSMQHVTEAFRLSVSEGPDYVCTVCHRKLFRKQVIQCKRDVYETKGEYALLAADRCITETYLHTCSGDCKEDCIIATGSSSKLWICHSCHGKVSRGKIPGESVVNKLHFEPIPAEIENLNELEQHLVSLHLPFMKLVALPKGAQNSVHGPVVSVPSNVVQSVNALPRSDSEDQLVQVKLKRKLTYKGHYKNQYVNKTKVLKALDYLHSNNKYYAHVELNENWVNPLPSIDEEDETVLQSDEQCEIDIETDTDNVDLTREESDNHGMLLDTCLQPVDIGQEILDQHFDEITSIAPAEGNNPIRMLQDNDDEAKAFPCLFPKGGPIYHDNREEKLTLSRYLHCRLMNADTRCAQSIPYIFHAQYRSELEQVISKASIALRKGIGDRSRPNINADTLSNNESLQNFLKNDDGYKFLTPIRGTPPYWATTQKDLFAMIRQLGIPTWFCSFSSAETRWPEIIESILREDGDLRKAEELDWNEKCTILRKNPVTTARMFDQRFHTFLRDVIMSPAQPIGKIKDYFFRVEFQQRGSPHVHCLFWVDNAPKIDENPDDEVVDFVNNYVSCDMPNEDDDHELHEIVTSVQRHSKRHSKTCRKNGKECRFNFPRPPSQKTFVCRSETKTVEVPVVDCDNMNEDERRAVELKVKEAIEQNSQIMKKEQAREILGNIWQALQDEDLSFDSVEDLFKQIGISQEMYETASQTLTKKTSVVLQRNSSDVWVNQYNPDLLRCWGANMDIQFVVDAYSCVVYIVSYISKAEKEMGLLLDHAQSEIRKEGNVDAKNAMRKIGTKYLNSREVSAQEAIFRVCTLDLKGCSRKVEFIPTVNRIRMSMPLKKLKEKVAKGDIDQDDIWLPSAVDKYRARPETAEFHDMCQATFISQYRFLSKSEVSNVSDEKRRTPVIALLNNLGHVKKRTNTDPAVVRYARFSKDTDPEKFYQASIELFLPHTSEHQMLPPQFETYEHFFNDGAITTASGELETVKSIVERNRQEFETNASDMQQAQEILEASGSLEDAWSQICPQAEVDRLECQDIRQNAQVDDDKDPEDDQNIPDLLPHEERVSRTETMQTKVSKEEAQTILKSLNAKQKDVFYKLRQWCLDKRNGKDPQPFNVFLTGGAGTGKSHLVKAFYYEATRLLAPTLDRPDDTSVLLMAPTANAAFNIKGSTIHSGLKIGIAVSNQYQYLCEDALNTLRSKCGGVSILIIDEISMVDQKLLAYVHGRLKQMKQKDLPFGNVSILAVGDFYQLPPVKGVPLYKSVLGYDLWNDCFSVVELTEIMRQKDPEFAALLNRLRKAQKVDRNDVEANIETEDVALLSSRVTGENPDCLHVLSTNAEVDKYNMDMLDKVCTDIFDIEIEEFGKNQRTGDYEVLSTTSHRIGIDARVLLTQNVDTSDGLVNGAFGKVSHVATEHGKVTTVYVVFDNIDVGKKLRAKKTIPAGIPLNSTPICRHDEKSTYSKRMKRRFPLKLAWACTIHKVQGLTVKQAVVSLKNIFAPGQAYVALSRVTSLEGLIIKDFDPKTIFCSSDVSEAISNMPQYCESVPNQNLDHMCHLVLHNIEGLPCHIDNLRSDKRFHSAECIFVTETWLSSIQHPALDGFMFRHKQRSQSYDESNPLFATLKSQSHGGVGVFWKNHCDFPQLQCRNLEYLTVFIPEKTTTVTVVYRPQTYKLAIFKKQLQVLLNELSEYSDKTIIVGDFNENALGTSSIQRFMEARNFTQIATNATTEAGTLPDHVYVRGINNVSVDVLPTYFSFHDALEIFF